MKDTDDDSSTVVSVSRKFATSKQFKLLQSATTAMEPSKLCYPFIVSGYHIDTHERIARDHKDRCPGAKFLKTQNFKRTNKVVIINK